MTRGLIASAYVASVFFTPRMAEPRTPETVSEPAIAAQGAPTPLTSSSSEPSLQPYLKLLDFVDHCRSPAREDVLREDGARDDALSGFDEELLQRVQAQLERIDFSLEGKKPAAEPEPAQQPNATSVPDVSKIPEGVTFEGLRMICCFCKLTSKGFTLPKTKQPLALGPPTKWSFFDWLKNLSGPVVHDIS